MINPDSSFLVDLEQAKNYLASLDLTYIVETMCAETYPLPRWSTAEALRCCLLYKNFLFLQKKHASFSLVPTREIDEFWHNHILYTKNYLYDCNKIFGYFLHHQPEPAVQDTHKLTSSFLKTKALYLEEFGQPLLLGSHE